MAVALVLNSTAAQQVPLPKFTSVTVVGAGGSVLRPINWASAKEVPLPRLTVSSPVTTLAGTTILPVRPLPGSAGGGGSSASTTGYPIG